MKILTNQRVFRAHTQFSSEQSRVILHKPGSRHCHAIYLAIRTLYYTSASVWL